MAKKKDGAKKAAKSKDPNTGFDFKIPAKKVEITEFRIYLDVVETDDDWDGTTESGMNPFGEPDQDDQEDDTDPDQKWHVSLGSDYMDALEIKVFDTFAEALKYVADFTKS